jgi:hypothetical protein
MESQNQARVNVQENGNATTISSTASTEDEADHNSSGKRKRPTSVSYDHLASTDWHRSDYTYPDVSYVSKGR